MNRTEVTAHQARVRRQLKEAGVPLAPDTEIEIADFGLGRFERTGLGLVVRVNEPEYCSKYLTLFPGQECPRHYHKLKKETFFALQGTVELIVDGHPVCLTPGQSLTLRPGSWHSFRSEAGAVIGEVSTHDENSDSYFDDPAIVRDPAVVEEG